MTFLELTEHFNPLEEKRLEILDPSGNILAKELEPKITKKDLLGAYKAMVRFRIADEKAFKLQRSGRMGTFAQVTGQEAQVGIGLAMKKEDWLVPSFRETALMTYLGWPLENFFLCFMGSEEGNRMPKGVNMMPISVPVGSQAVQAVGISWASKMRKEKACTVTMYGDGGSSIGEVHEAMTFASTFKTPTIFICQNNQYAISTPRSHQSNAKTIAQKGIAYDIPSIQVDGNDVLSLYLATGLALEHARSGHGPCFIESHTYRICDHTTADDASVYRSDEEVEQWKKKDPILRLKAYLEDKKLWSDKQEEDLIEGLNQEIESAVKKAESTPPPLPQDIFKYTYKELTSPLQEQQEDLLRSNNA